MNLKSLRMNQDNLKSLKTVFSNSGWFFDSKSGNPVFIIA